MNTNQMCLFSKLRILLEGNESPLVTTVISGVAVETAEYSCNS